MVTQWPCAFLVRGTAPVRNRTTQCRNSYVTKLRRFIIVITSVFTLTWHRAAQRFHWLGFLIYLQRQANCLSYLGECFSCFEFMRIRAICLLRVKCTCIQNMWKECPTSVPILCRITLKTCFIWILLVLSHYSD